MVTWMLEVVKTYFPAVHERTNRQEFRLCDDQGYMQIAIKPVVRKPYLLVDGKLILGCGDSVVLNDPITGQGSNTTSYCA